METIFGGCDFARPRTLHLLDRKITAINAFLTFCETGVIPEYPIEVFLELSNVCNMKCVMCPTFSGINIHRHRTLKVEERGFFETESAQKFLGQLLERSLVVHAFGYGEPTIHPEFIRFMEELRKYEVMIDFITNGMRLDETHCQFLVEQSIYKVSISFSGASAEEYENVYLGGDFDKIVKGIRRLDQIKRTQGRSFPIIEINSIGFEHHMNKLVDFVELMGSCGVNVIHVKPLNVYRTTTELLSHAAVCRPEVEGEVIRKASQRAKELGIIFCAEPFQRTTASTVNDVETQRSLRLVGGALPADQIESRVDIKGMRDYSKSKKALPPLPEGERLPNPTLLDVNEEEAARRIKIETPSRRPKYRCFEPYKTMYIRKDGNVKPCCFSDNLLYYGNVRRHSHKEIWTGPGYGAAQRSMPEGRYPMGSCHHCIEQEMMPSDHVVDRTAREYQRWHQNAFRHQDEIFAPEIFERFQKCRNE